MSVYKVPAIAPLRAISSLDGRNATGEFHQLGIGAGRQSGNILREVVARNGEAVSDVVCCDDALRRSGVGHIPHIRLPLTRNRIEPARFNGNEMATLRLLAPLRVFKRKGSAEGGGGRLIRPDGRTSVEGSENEGDVCGVGVLEGEHGDSFLWNKLWWSDHLRKLFPKSDPRR